MATGLSNVDSREKLDINMGRKSNALILKIYLELDFALSAWNPVESI